MQSGFRMPFRFFALVLLLSACGAPPVAEQPTTVSSTVPTSAPTEPPAANATALPAPSATAEPSATATTAPTATTTGVPSLPPPSPTPEFPTGRLDASTFANIELLRTEGFGQARAAAVSPDNRLLAVATTAGVAWFDLATFEHLRFDRIVGGATDLAFSADGSLIELVFGWPYSTTPFEQRRVDSGELVGSVPAPPGTGEFPRIFFSPDEQLRAELNVPDSVPTPGVQVFRTTDEQVIYRDEATISVNFSPDSRLLLPVDYQGTVRIVDSVSGAERSLELAGYMASVFSPDALSLVAAGRDLRIWDVVSGELREPPLPINIAGEPGLLGFQQSIRFSADGSLLTIDGDYSIFEATLRRSETWQFDPAGLQPLWQQSAGGSGVINYATYVGALSPATPAFALSDDGVNLTIDGDGQPARNLAFTEPIKALAFSPDGAILAVGDQAGVLHLVRVADGGEITQFGIEERITQMVFNRDGSRIAVGLAGGDVVVQPMNGNQAAQRISGVLQPIIFDDIVFGPPRFRFSPDDSMLLAWDNNGARFYNLGDGSLMHTIAGRIDDVDIGPQRRLVSLLRDGRIELWGLPN